MTGLVTITEDGPVLTLALANPAKKNAISPEMNRTLAEALIRADKDNAIRAVILHGDGPDFTAGADVGHFLKVARGDAAYEAPSPFVRALASFEKPLVAAVQGLAIGVGTTGLLHCDIVYAAPDVRFRMSFADLGLVPEAGSSLLLPLLCGYQKAAELLMLARAFGAEEALSMGLIAAIDADPLARARDAAAALAAKPPAALRATKALLKRARATREAMEAEAEIFGARMKSPEAQEAFSAILEKRTPDFSQF
jgi:enoyl-CoA hydratase/carnithine racemase